MVKHLSNEICLEISNSVIPYPNPKYIYTLKFWNQPAKLWLFYDKNVFIIATFYFISSWHVSRVNPSPNKHTTILLPVGQPVRGLILLAKVTTDYLVLSWHCLTFNSPSSNGQPKWNSQNVDSLAKIILLQLISLVIRTVRLMVGHFMEFLRRIFTLKVTHN